MEKRSYKQRLWMGILLLAVIILSFSIFKIISWNNDNKKTKEVVKDINKIIETDEVKASSEDKLVNAPINSFDNDYWNYIKLPFTNVDFSQLLKKNKDTVAFLKVNGTNINYPVVKKNDNSYYLTHSYDQTYNAAGWVFMDYRNNINELGKNTIIYAHGRWDNTMFGSLKNVFKNDWYNNTDNYVVNLATPSYNSLWQIFSVYKIKTESYYITTSFYDDFSYQTFINTIINRSAYKFKASVDINDKILTLSTCFNDTEKVVLHAKLIKTQIK